MAATEKYYTLADVQALLSIGNRKARYLLHDGEFGDGVVNIGGDHRPDYRIPASGINGYLERNKVRQDHAEPGLAARCVGELRRKALKSAA